MAKIRRIDNSKTTRDFNIKRPYLLYLSLALVFVSTSTSLFATNFRNFLVDGASFLLLFGSTWLISKGIVQTSAYNKASITKAPNIHYLLMGAIGLGTTTSFLSFFYDKGFWISLFVGALAVAGSLLYYGNDPKIDKTNNIHGISAQLVIDTINEANAKIDSIEAGSKQINDSLLSANLQDAIKKARQIVAAIEKDPKDIRVSRKFLIIYVDGVKNVVESYNQLDPADINSQTRDKLHNLFTDIESKFDQELQKLKENNQFDLDIHIETLKEHIKH